MRANNAKEVYEEYGRNWVQFFIVDVERLEEWQGINNLAFGQALVNANAPHFDPEADLRLPDPDGSLYDAAVAAAWDALLVAFAREEDD